MTITERVRNAIPNILKEYGSMNFNELFKELAKQFGDELYDGEKERTGVLRGITQKIDSIPIENVVYEKSSNGMVYRYVDSPLEELIKASSDFITDINIKGLLAINILNLTKEQRELYQKYQDILIQLHQLNESK